MTFLRCVRLLALVLVWSVCPVLHHAYAQHDPTFAELTPYYLQLFSQDKGWAPLVQDDVRAIATQNPKDPDQPGVVEMRLRRATSKEGVVEFSFSTYARAEWARDGFARFCRQRFDAHAAPNIGAIRNIHTASADGRTLVWGMQVEPGGGKAMASYEVAALFGERYLYGRADLHAVSAELAVQTLENMKRAAEMFREHLGDASLTATPVASARPELELEATPQPVAAGAQARIMATLTERQGQERRPLTGRALTVELFAAGGPVVGQLSATTVATDAAGRAHFTYTAPEREAMPTGALPRAMLRVTSTDPAISETLPIDLDNRSTLSVTPSHLILPAQAGFHNQLTVHFEAPRGEHGKAFTVHLRCGSSGGRLAPIAGGEGQSQLETKLASGVDNTLLYSWGGPLPQEQAVAETVSVEIPELKLHAETTFSVGIDLMLESVRLSWKGPFYPGMALPVEAALADRFHPGVDLAALLSDLKIEPELVLTEKSFAPLPLGSTLGTQFLANLVHGVAGAFMPRGSITRGLPFADARQSKDGRWLLLWKDQPLAEAFPQVLPNDIGNYLFEIGLDPRLDGDPNPDLHTMTLQVSVQEIPPEEDIVFTFALPTAQAMAAYATPLKAFGVAWNVASQLHEGNPAQAVHELGKAYLLPEGNKWLAKLAKKKGLPYAQALMAELRERLPAATVAKLEAVMAREAAALDEPWVKGMIEQFDLDMVEGTVGAITNGVEGWLAEKAGIGPKPSANFWRWWAVDQAVAARPAPQLYDAARFFQQFLQDSGRYGVLIVSRRGLTNITATDAAGRPIPLQEGGQIFDHFGRHGRLLDHVVVIPFMRNEQFHIALAGEGDVPVKVFKVLGDGMNHGLLGGTGQPWEKELLVDGTAVR